MPDIDEEPGSGPRIPRAGTADERFADSVRRLRGDMSQGELARRMKALGWPYYQQTVAKVERGERKPSVGEAEALAAILGSTTARMTMPGPEASAITLLEQFTDTALAAREQAADSVLTLLHAQAQLRVTVDEAEKAGWYGSRVVELLVAEARQVIALDPLEAAGEGAARYKEMTEAAAQERDAG